MRPTRRLSHDSINDVKTCMRAEKVANCKTSKNSLGEVESGEMLR